MLIGPRTFFIGTSQKKDAPAQLSGKPKVYGVENRHNEQASDVDAKRGSTRPKDA